MHEWDGVVQDLSPAGVASGVSRLGRGPVLGDSHDEAHLAAAEAGLRCQYEVAEVHRRNPLVHLANMDLSCYERAYAPAEQRAEARRRHLEGWPEAVDAALASLDMVAAPVAEALLPAVRGLAAGVQDETALASHRRLVGHLEGQAHHGDPDPALGATVLAALLGDEQAMALDLGRLAERADAERDRLRERLGESCRQLRPGTTPEQLLPELLADHPSEAEEIYAEARRQVAEVTAFTVERGLLPDPGGECLVGPAPESRRMAMAMMSWTAPFEPDAPSWYHVTPPEPDWPAEEREEWLSVFSRTTLPAITVHEVTPGHYAHGRMLREVRGDVRRALFSSSFVEGWAHYAEELFVEEGFRADDPRFAIGVWVEALIRVTRLAVSLGVHTGGMSMAEAARRFESDAFLRGRAARSEAGRATWDPTYGRYTWGKLEIQAVRDDAMALWGGRYSHLRFHLALLALGAPPLGLLGDAVSPRL